MIVQSLARYYDILAGDDTVKISRPGYSPAKVSFALVISLEGSLTNILDLRTDGKKKLPKIFDVPYQKSRTVAVTPYFTCDNAKYVFGIERIKTDGKQSSDEIIENIDVIGKEKIVVTKRSLDCYDQFRILHHSLLNDIRDARIQSFLKFLDDWKPVTFLSNPKVVEYKDEISSGGLFIFDLDGKYLHQYSEVLESWESYFLPDKRENGRESDNERISQCLVTGQIAPIAQTHQKIRGVYNPKGQIAETSLISFNKDAFWSYGKKQSYNAPVSESAMFKYTTVLNYLLERDSKNKIQIGDASTVFWAETKNKAYEDLILSLLNPVESRANGGEEPQEERLEQDHSIRQLINHILLKVKSGAYLEDRDLGIPKTTKFYILGLSPNNARLAVRYWHEDNFGNFITCLARHHIDMEIDAGNWKPQFISVKSLLKQTVPRDADIPPLIEGLLMRSIIENTPYPIPMYHAILNRVKVERSINYARAGFIKAYLMRIARTRKQDEDDVITVSLNEESTNVPYRLGRLFAVLESAQKAANPSIKRTIRDSYFASAATMPSMVYPVLLKLHQHHLSKINSEKPGLGVNISKSIDEVMSSIDRFPITLTLEEQGMLMLGYYHQHESFFRKNDDNKSIEEELKS